MLNISSNLATVIGSAMDTLIGGLGKTCTLYYPPIQSSIISPQLVPVGSKTVDLSLEGNNSPFQYGQNSPLEFGNNFIGVEQTEDIIMTILWNPKENFDSKFPNKNRYADGNILTHGYVSDLQKVLNCNYMETFKDANSRYRFKLRGEPAIPDQLTNCRYFFAWWDRS